LVRASLQWTRWERRCRRRFEQRQSVMPRPAASFSNTTAVGLLSPRSIKEIIDRLTPDRFASASIESSRASRNSRKRPAIWAVMSVSDESTIQDPYSNILDCAIEGW